MLTVANRNTLNGGGFYSNPDHCKGMQNTTRHRIANRQKFHQPARHKTQAQHQQPIKGGSFIIAHYQESLLGRNKATNSQNGY